MDALLFMLATVFAAMLTLLYVATWLWFAFMGVGITVGCAMPALSGAHAVARRVVRRTPAPKPAPVPPMPQVGRLAATLLAEMNGGPRRLEVICPATGQPSAIEVLKVHGPEGDRLQVVRCANFGDRDVTCMQLCLQA
ncbi:MAG TPA: hypothetical protein VNO81_12495 [Candidatus Nitrosotenuis sp.]|nr:hypothetical protein [Candidatus Nitrosotenuis sp.]